MAARDDKVLSFGSPNASPPPAQALAGSRSSSNQIGDSLLSRLGELLGNTLRDAASIEVRTYSSTANDSGLASVEDPLTQGARLRAFTRAAFDGDTSICVPLNPDGSLDVGLWEVHKETSAAARADRARAIELTITAVQQIFRAVR